MFSTFDSLVDIAEGRAVSHDHYLVSGVGGLSSTSTSRLKHSAGETADLDEEGGGNDNDDDNNISMTCSADDEDDFEGGEHSPNSERRTEFGELVEAGMCRICGVMSCAWFMTQRIVHAEHLFTPQKLH